MRLIATAALTVVLTLPALRTARAQLAVIDGPGDASAATTATTVGQIAGDTDQLVTPTNQTQTNTANTATNTSNIESTLTTVPSTSGDFPSDAGAGADDSVLNPMPTYSQVQTALGSTGFDNGSSQSMGGGDSTLSSTASTIYGQNPATNPGTDPVLQAQDGVLRVSSNIEGMAVDNLQQLQARLQEIGQLITDLNEARSITAVTAINAKLAIAEVAVEAQTAQAANLSAIATAQSEINRENEAQAMRNEHLQTASLLSGLATGLGSSSP